MLPEYLSEFCVKATDDLKNHFFHEIKSLYDDERFKDESPYLAFEVPNLIMGAFFAKVINQLTNGTKEEETKKQIMFQSIFFHTIKFLNAADEVLKKEVH